MVQPQAAASVVAETLEHHAAMVYRVAYRVLRNAADAEDVTQEVFLKLLTLSLRKPSSANAHVAGPPTRTALPRAGEMRAWLARITLNKSLNALRDAKSRRARERQWCEQSGKGKEPAVGAASGNMYDEGLRHAVLGLPTNLRLPVILHYQEGLKYKEIALALDCPEGTIAKRIHSAKRQLRERLGLSGTLLLTQLGTLPQDPELTPSDLFLERLQQFVDTKLAELTPQYVPSTPLTISQRLQLNRSRLWGITAGVLATLLLSVGIVPYLLHDSTTTVPSSGQLAAQLRDSANREHEQSTKNSTDENDSTPSRLQENASKNATQTPSATTPLLWGIVRDPEEQIVTGVQVELLRSDHVIDTTTTDDRGRYTFATVSPPSTAAADSSSPATQTPDDVIVVKSTLTPDSEAHSPSPTSPSLTPQPEPATPTKTRGTVRGARRMGTGSSLATTSPLRGLKLRFSHAEYLPLETTPIGEPLKPDTQRHVTLTPTLLLEGWVFDTHAQPIVGAEVKVVGSVANLPGNLHPSEATDDSGRFRFLQLRKGVYILRVMAEGYLPHTFIAQAGEEELHVRLDRGVVVEISLRDSEDRSARDTDVRVLQAKQGTAYQITNANGVARFPNMAPGSAIVEVYAGPLRLQSEAIEIPDFDLFQHQLVVANGIALNGTVLGSVLGVDDDSAALLIHLIAAEDAKKKLTTRVNEIGQFTFDRLPPGDYWIDVYQPSGSWHQQFLMRQRLQLTPRQSKVKLDLGATLQCELSVAIDSAAGETIENAFVIARKSDGAVLTLPISSNGTPVQLPYGEYEFEFGAWRYEKTRQRHTLAAEKVSIEVTLERFEQSHATTNSHAEDETLAMLPERGFAVFQNGIPLAVYIEWLDRISEGGVRVDPAISVEMLHSTLVRPSGPIRLRAQEILTQQELELERRGNSLWVVLKAQ